MKKDKTYLRRIVSGPSREELFDCLRLGEEISYFDEFLWSNIHKERLGSIPLVQVGRLYDNDTWRIKYMMPGHHKPFEAFYSTKTRLGFICRAEEISSLIFPGCVVPAYRPLTDYQVMGLLQLASISRNTRLAKHIKVRLMRAIQGVGYSSEQCRFVHSKTKVLSDLFTEVLEEPINQSTIVNFRKILG